MAGGGGDVRRDEREMGSERREGEEGGPKEGARGRERQRRQGESAEEGARDIEGQSTNVRGIGSRERKMNERGGWRGEREAGERI